MLPRGIVRVYAMARPRRPDAEGLAVREAVADWRGSAASRSRRLAIAVAKAAMADIDVAPEQRLLAMLARLVPSPVSRLATDPAIDTAAFIRAARAAALEAHGWRRLTDGEWREVDRTILDAMTARLAKRYARHLSNSRP